MNKLIDKGFILPSTLPDLIDCLQEFIPAWEQWQAESHYLEIAQFVWLPHGNRLYRQPWKQVHSVTIWISQLVSPSFYRPKLSEGSISTQIISPHSSPVF